MRLTQLFVNRPPMVFVAIALVSLLGAFALSTLVQQNFPNIDFPTINVSVSYPGAPPSELRDAVVRPIEDAIAGAPNLDHINTSIQQNQANISATFSLDSDQTTDLVEVQDRVQSARSALPADLPAPSIRTFDPAQATVVTLSLTSNSLSIAGLSAIVTDKIVPALEQAGGVSNVGAGGTVTPAIEVTVDPNSLASYGFTSNDVVSAIQSNNVRAPGGIAYSSNRETSIDVRGDVQTPQSVASLLLSGSTSVLHGATSPSGTITQKYTGTSGSTNQALALSSNASSGAGAAVTNPFSTSARLPRVADVAAVTDWYEPKRVASYVDGRAAITLNVQKASGASEVVASRSVLAALPAIERQFPDVAFRVLNVQADFTEQQLWSVLQTLIEGIVFTGVAMLFFLRSWRNALVVMIAIPTSLCVSFFVMKLFNYTIDTVSLLAMTLIIGILVDDSIVVLENIGRHFEDGEAPRTAAILGRSEIGAAAVVITLVDVVVFLPIAFLPGQTGRFLSEFGVVVVIATLTSLAVSFTITPALAGNWSLRSRWRAPRFIDWFTAGFDRVRTFYTDRVLAVALRHRIPVVVVAGLLTLGAIALVEPLGIIGFEFIPSVDRGEIFATVQFPTGTPLEKTDAAVKLISTRFLDLPDVQRITSTSGTMQQGFGGGVNLGSTGQVRVFLNPDRKHSTVEIARMMTGLGHRLVPDARVIAIPATGTRGGNAQPIDVTVSATRGEPDNYAGRVLQALEDTPGTANVNSSALQYSPQIDIQFDRDRARALNVDIGSASQAVRAAFGGTLATQFDTNNGTKYVQVLYPRADQTSLATLRAIALRSRTGAIVHLGDIAVLQNAPAQALITRVNRQTVIHISANVQPGVAQTTVQRAFMQRVRDLHLPNTIVVGAAPGGNQQNIAQTVNGLGTALLLSFLLVYLLMVALYDAYRVPLVIMFSIPVAAIGAFGALALTGQTLNLFSLIGVIMLVGLVSKNGILLVDFAILKVHGGMDKLTAIKQSARERFRPIVMTTTAMIAGMTPLALALDPGSAAKRSLGTVVIGGLASSLLLTLVVIPIVYLWIAPGPPPPRPSEETPEPGPTASLAVESR
ncbi:MAG TPA: efflux RND transporter permease subunit [Candidatus Elarobacter sp.]|nr:efflux RND transporter permease subunit [Candidatus Elarobacter sp.]